MLFRLNYIIILLLFLQFASSGRELSIPFRSVPGQPYFQSPQVTIDSAEYDTVILRLKAKQKGTARFFWANHYDPQFNQPKSIWFSFRAGYHDYYFNVPSQNPNWIGWINGFLIYPETDRQNFKINAMKVIRGNPGANIKSSWQEFWGPKGRVVIGSTINLIASSSVFGKSINIYVYWLIGILFAIIFGVKFYQNKVLSLSLSETIRQTFVITIILWIILGLNSAYNFFNIFKDNYSKYYGKTIEKKRAAAYGNEYYEFLVFAKNKLPEDPTEFGVLSSRYAPDLQARIYLIPHVLSNYKEKKLPYLLVYHPDQKQLSETNSYSLFARQNNNAYIMKRNKQ